MFQWLMTIMIFPEITWTFWMFAASVSSPPTETRVPRSRAAHGRVPWNAELGWRFPTMAGGKAWRFLWVFKWFFNIFEERRDTTVFMWFLRKDGRLPEANDGKPATRDKYIHRKASFGCRESHTRFYPRHIQSQYPMWSFWNMYRILRLDIHALVGMNGWMGRQSVSGVGSGTLESMRINADQHEPILFNHTLY